MVVINKMFPKIRMQREMFWRTQEKMKTFIDFSSWFKWLSRIPPPNPKIEVRKLFWMFQGKNRTNKENKMKERCKTFGEFVEALFMDFRISNEADSQVFSQIREHIYQ